MRQSHDAAGRSGAAGGTRRRFSLILRCCGRELNVNSSCKTLGAASALRFSVYSANGTLESAAFMSLL